MILTAFLLAPAALVQGPPPPPARGPQLMPPFLHLAEELGLSEGQKAQLKAIFDSHRTSMEAKSDAGRQAHEALMEAVRQGSGDLTALNQEAASRQLALLQEAQQIHAACLALLTPEQREKAKSLRPPRPGMEGARPGHGPQGGHPTRPRVGEEDRPGESR